MKSLKALSAALGLVASISTAPALAAGAPLFIFDSADLYLTPSIGTVQGLAVVDDGLLAGNTPWGRPYQLLMDSQGLALGDPALTFLGAIPFPTNVPEALTIYQYGFTAAIATTYQFTYNFLTNFGAGTAGDFFHAALFNAANAQTELAYADTISSGLFASSSLYLFETGYKVVEFTVAAGTYTAQFILGTDQAGCVIPAGTCIPTGVVLNSVPEPTTLALVALAVLGVARRRQTLAA